MNNSQIQAEDQASLEVADAKESLDTLEFKINRWIELTKLRQYSAQSERLIILLDFLRFYLPRYGKHVGTSTKLIDDDIEIPAHLIEAKEKAILSILKEIEHICNEEELHPTT